MQHIADAEPSVPPPTAAEPSESELSRRPRGIVFDRDQKYWQWKDAVLRQWAPRPNVFDIAERAQITLGTTRAARKLGVSVQTLAKLIARGAGALPIVIAGAAHNAASLSELAEEL